MQSPNRNKAILILVILLPIIISFTVFIFVSQRQGNGTEEYLDPGSGETVSNPKDKTPEQFGTTTDGPLFLGFSKLINAGLSTSQLDLVKTALTRFSASDERYIAELSVTVSTIDQTIDEDGINMTFDLTANRKTKYKCTVSYSSPDDAKVLIADDAGVQIFDSSTQ